MTGYELMATIQAIEALQAKGRQELAINEVDDSNPEDQAQVQSDERMLRALGDMLRDLKARADGPQSFSFSTLTDEHLDKMGISRSGLLLLKTGANSRALQASNAGSESVWSAEMLYRHLQYLESHVSLTNECSARLWINAFLLRATAMVPPTSKTVFSVEQLAPYVTFSTTNANTLSGYIDWTVVVTSSQLADAFLQKPILRELKNGHSTLFVSEAKCPSQSLAEHIPQAIGEMVGCAKNTGKFTIRGVLTNGRKWLFLVLKLGQDGGGSYLQSKEIDTFSGFESTISKDGTILISAIIAHWVMHSHDNFKSDDDYFSVAK